MVTPHRTQKQKVYVVGWFGWTLLEQFAVLIDRNRCKGWWIVLVLHKYPNCCTKQTLLSVLLMKQQSMTPLLDLLAFLTDSVCALFYNTIQF